MRQGTAAGVFEETEQDMIEAVFQLGDKSARALMTPRTQIVWLDENGSAEGIRAKLTDSGHSRFPVCGGSLDNVLGVVYAKDLLTGFLSGGSFDLGGRCNRRRLCPALCQLCRCWIISSNPAVISSWWSTSTAASRGSSVITTSSKQLPAICHWVRRRSSPKQCSGSTVLGCLTA